ncbi:hypothetical protein GS399_17740 [Pedobacter sp. HMF7647]|uniref:NADP-dependent oxidoreductase domain-containing protein n=1 Tax=Hufsiella arboris TaxID=2695275 RepID=A0A7K1YFG7_9SPHI|nr:aldo/keto reductase [Hufsiella arboris]MXV52818.1 hypothetical protein [Hufsiella arboris]
MSDLINQHFGFGCVALASQKDLRSALTILDKAYISGIRYFDTAPVYSKGYSERILGTFIKNKRSEVIVTTKFGLSEIKPSRLPLNLMLWLKYKLKGVNHASAGSLDLKPEQHDLLPRIIERKEIEKSFKQSLENLQTDYIDCFLLHEGLSEFLTEDALAFLISLKEDGRIAKLGLATNFHNTAREKNLNIWDVIQYENSPHDTRSDDFVLQHPDKTHIYHSVLKGLSQINTNDKFTKPELAGIILSHEHRKNPSGKILFSTTSPIHLEENLKQLTRFETWSKVDLKQEIDYAFS